MRHKLITLTALSPLTCVVLGVLDTFVIPLVGLRKRTTFLGISHFAIGKLFHTMCRDFPPKPSRRIPLRSLYFGFSLGVDLSMVMLCGF